MHRIFVLRSQSRFPSSGKKKKKKKVPIVDIETEKERERERILEKENTSVLFNRYAVGARGEREAERRRREKTDMTL